MSFDELKIREIVSVNLKTVSDFKLNEPESYVAILPANFETHIIYIYI